MWVAHRGFLSFIPGRCPMKQWESIKKKKELKVNLLFIISVCHTPSAMSAVKHSSSRNYFIGLTSSNCCIHCWADETLTPRAAPLPTTLTFSTDYEDPEQREQSRADGWSKVPWMAAEERLGGNENRVRGLRLWYGWHGYQGGGGGDWNFQNLISKHFSWWQNDSSCRNLLTMHFPSRDATSKWSLKMYTYVSSGCVLLGKSPNLRGIHALPSLVKLAVAATT